MNASFKSSIADVNLATVAATDPLWPPNLAASPAAAKLSTGLSALPASAARSLDQIIFPAHSRR
jgi:hypothetical protein